MTRSQGIKNVELKDRIRGNINATSFKIRCAACKCQHIQTKEPGSVRAHPPSSSPSPFLGANLSQHLPKSRKLLPLRVFNTSLFLSVCQLFHLQPFILPLTPPCAAVYTALLFGNRHLLASFHQSVSLTPRLPLASGFYAEDFSAFWCALSIACQVPRNIKPW